MKATTVRNRFGAAHSNYIKNASVNFISMIALATFLYLAFN
jgi:hypothetical protein